MFYSKILLINVRKSCGLGHKKFSVPYAQQAVRLRIADSRELKHSGFLKRGQFLLSKSC